MITDRQSNARETLEIMSMKRSAYTIALFFTQSCFTIVSGCILFLGFVLANSNAYAT